MPPTGKIPFSSAPRLILGTLVLAGLTLLAYAPALHGGFIWDDDNFLTQNPLIRAADGLRRLWLTTQADDYWPLTSTTMWVEWRLWGMNAAGYHVTNVVLHIAESLLLWRVLLGLRIPGAFLGALFFALHPVNVESVAWITQRKNLVAMLFFLLSILCFLKTDPGVAPGPSRRPGGWRWYGLSLLAFALALLGKGSVAPLPLVLMGIILWRRPLEAGDWIRMAPFFAVAAIFTGVNIWFQSHTYEPVRDAGFVERMLGAAAALWFYAGKAVWPANLCFVYPRWSLRLDDLRWWLPLLAAALVTAGLGLLGRRGGPSWARPAWFAWLYFCVMLAPVLGFTDVAFMQYSLVADHYQHLALIGVTTLAATGLVSWIGGLPTVARPAGWALSASLVGILGLLTLRQSSLYRDSQTLYTATIERNPGCWLAQNNLANDLAALPGRMPEALAHYEEALRNNPNYAKAHNNLANALATMPGRMPEALAHYEEALRIDPKFAEAHNNLANALATLPGRMPEAIAHYEEALRSNPLLADAHYNLANALASLPGQIPEALAHYQQALRLNPLAAEVHFNLADALATLPGRMPEALAEYEEALRINPDFAEAHNNLANALMAMPGRTSDAIAHYEQALRINPKSAEAQANLAASLATIPGRVPEALAHYEEALRINPNFAEAHYYAGLLCAQTGRFDEAMAHWQQALKLNPALTEAREALNELQAMRR
jgi:protein O-mannosyl-transferase